MSLLTKQYLIHNGKLIWISLSGLIAGLFVLLYSIQRYTRFETWTQPIFTSVFIAVFMVLGVIYVGSSFPGLRSRDKAMQYLTLPMSTTRKFLFELFTRVVLYALLMPALFWVIFYLEGQLVALINPNFTFVSFSYLDGFGAPTAYQRNLLIAFVASHVLLCLTVPFFGATVFMKHQIAKTIAWGFGLLVSFFVLFNDFVETIPKRHMQEFTCFIILLNIALIALAYFNLKNKQV